MAGGRCESAGAPDTQTKDDDHGFTRGYEIIDTGDLVLADAEEDWCNTLEGSAGAWLVANERDLIVDRSSGEPNTLDQDTVRLLETVVSDGAAAISPDEFEDLDTFLRFPIPSPLACKTAFEERNK
jgi:hypothetical protein